MDRVFLTSCNLCPRGCRIDRTDGKKGRCGETADIQIARAQLHMWEEPCLSGRHGAGTVFFCGCPLGCVYCQNYDIAHGKNGVTVTERELADVFLKLQEMKANNIDLVTPTHYIPQISGALQDAKRRGLTIPIVYNTASYERVSALSLLEGQIDIFLGDLKYYDPGLSKLYSDAPDYFEKASDALAEMVRQQGTPVFRPNGLMTKGVIVRILLLPGQLEDAKRLVKYVWETYGNAVWVSLMSQYTPMPQIKEKFPELDRRVTPEEYDALVGYAADLGMTQAYVQEGESAKESFIPDFEHFDLERFLNS